VGTHFESIVPRNWDCEAEYDVAPPRRGGPDSDCVVERHESHPGNCQSCNCALWSECRISTACSFDIIKLRVGRNVVPNVAHVVIKFQLDRSRISAIPGFYKVVPSIYEGNITGDDDLVAVPNSLVVGSLLIAE
jgi:hypothetical protein